MKDKEILLGIKLGMTQVYDEQGFRIPVTVVQAGPCPIVQVKTIESDGYNAIQLGFKAQKAHRLTQPELGHLKKAGIQPVVHLQEFRISDPSQYTIGHELNVSLFNKGESVDVIGNTKGRGFQGVVKRFRHRGGPASHGSMTHRRGGSYGQREFTAEIMKGKKMPGHMGNVRRTVQNLEVVDIILEKNLLLIRGSFAGYNGSLIVIRKAIKTKSIVTPIHTVKKK
jgi:large subunit ribosomal protein L3